MEEESVSDTIRFAVKQLSQRGNCTVPLECIPEGVVTNFTMHLRYLWMLGSPRAAIDELYALPIRDLINDAIPPFTILIFAEYLVARLYTGRWSHLAEYLPNIHNGMLLQTFRLAFHAAEFWLYGQVYDYWHLPLADSVDWSSWTAWISVVILTDFCYYVFHRVGHETAFFWAMHQVHHSSDYFNYSVSFRIPHLHDFAHSGLFHLPLALLGLPPELAFLHKTLNLLYQFWLHSEAIPKLGPFEWIFNTASHHRVHHARQAKYLDKNYGSLLIIWDRLFGTFCEEDENDKPIYGVTTLQSSLNVFYIQYVGWAELWDKMRSMDGWKNKLLCVIKGPGWEPGSPWTGYPEKVPVATRIDRMQLKPLSWYWKLFLFADIFMTVSYFGVVLFRYPFLSTNVFYAMIVILYLNAWCLSVTLEAHPYADVVQVIRLMIWRFILQPMSWRLIAQPASPMDRVLHLSADGLAFTLLIASCIHLMLNYRHWLGGAVLDPNKSHNREGRYHYYLKWLMNDNGNYSDDDGGELLSKKIKTQ